MNAQAFGIHGDFPGDDALISELNWCCQAFQSPSTSKPPLARLAELLGSLPLKGRQAVVRNYLASSPHRDAILRDLFDYCFQPDDDSDEDSEDGKRPPKKARKRQTRRKGPRVEIEYEEENEAERLQEAAEMAW